MNQMISISARVGEMSSLDFLNQIVNPSRIAAGESEVRPSDFHARVTDEVDEVLNYDNFVVGKTGHKTHYTMLTMEQMTLVGMRESKAVRRQVLEKLKVLGRQQVPQTYAAALLEAGRLAMELEQSQAQLAIAAPKADVFDRVIEREALLNATQVAQQIGMSAIKMNRKLDELGGVYNKCVKRGRAFCHDWVLSGYGEMKITEMGYPQPLFTTKGSLRVAEIFTSEGVV